MNIEQWISCIAEAYETAGEAFSSRKKEILLEELPEDSPSIDQATRLSIEAGIIPKPIEIQDESLNNVIDETKELVIRYFFKKFTLGETFGSIARVEQHFGRSLENNYDISSGPFIDMAKTYWAYQLEVRDLFPKYHNLVLAQVLVEVESRIGSVFFPFPGPIILWVRGRRETQRELLEEFAPEMDIDAFLDNNPLLGTSKGRIAKTVFSEKVWVRCPNPNCLRFLKIPNTVKRLEIKCPKCKKSFLFPAQELKWLNHLEPHFHPAPDKIKELENLRQLWTIPDEVFADQMPLGLDMNEEEIEKAIESANSEAFAMTIIGTYWATEQLQRQLFERGKDEAPRASDKEIFREIITSRTENRIPLGLDMNEEEIEKAIESINSIDDLVDFVLSKESEEPPWPDPLGIRSRIEEILRS